MEKILAILFLGFIIGGPLYIVLGSFVRQQVGLFAYHFLVGYYRAVARRNPETIRQLGGDPDGDFTIQSRSGRRLVIDLRPTKGEMVEDESP